MTKQEFVEAIELMTAGELKELIELAEEKLGLVPKDTPKKESK